MKNRFINTILKGIGIILGILGVLCLITYVFLWNPHVNLNLNKSESFPLTVEQKLEDFDSLFNTLNESFPYFEVKERQYGFDWLGNKEEFIDRIAATENDLEFYYTIQEILALLQNGHTNIIEPGEEFDDYSEIYAGPTPWGQVFGNKDVLTRYDYWESIVPETNTAVIPVAFEYIEGDYYASRNIVNPDRSTAEFDVPSGSRLLMVDGIDTDTYVSNLINRRILKLDTIRNKLKVSLLTFNTDKSVEFTLMLPSGEIVSRVLKPHNPDLLSDVVKTRPNNLYSTKILEEGKIAYLRLPSLASSYVDKDRSGIRTFLEKIKDYPALIIDIRGNGGGSTNYWMHNIVPLLTNDILQTRNYILFRNSEYIKPFIKHKMLFGYLGLKPLSELGFGNENPGLYFNSTEGRFTDFD